MKLLETKVKTEKGSRNEEHLTRNVSDATDVCCFIPNHTYSHRKEKLRDCIQLIEHLI